MRAAGGAAALGALTRYEPLLARAAMVGLRPPDSLPDPTRPAGEPTTALPFDHIMIVMQEGPGRGEPG